MAPGERPGSGRSEAAGPFRDLLAAFERRHGVDREVREAAARVLLRADTRRGLALGLSYPARLAAGRLRRRREERAARKRATPWLEQLAASPRPLRVTVVSPEPTPYRSPLLDLVSARPEVRARRDLCSADRRRPHVVGRAAAPDHFPARTQAARARPVASSRLSRHTGSRARPAGIAPGCRRRVGLEHVRVAGRDRLVSSAESSIRAARRESRSRPAPRLAACGEGTVVPRVLRKAAGALALGPASRESLVAGARTGTRACLREHDRRCRLGGARRELRARRSELRARLGAADDDVVVLSRRPARTGKGSRHARSCRCRRRGTRACWSSWPATARNAPRSRSSPTPEESAAPDRRSLRRAPVAETYVAADIFALLSTHEPWGVVVNEAAASALPLVLSDRVGAAVRPAARRRERRARPCRRRRGDGRRARTARRRSGDLRERAPDAARASSSAAGATSLRSRASSPPCARRPPR